MSLTDGYENSSVTKNNMPCLLYPLLIKETCCEKNDCYIMCAQLKQWKIFDILYLCFDMHWI